MTVPYEGRYMRKSLIWIHKPDPRDERKTILELVAGTGSQ